MPSKDIPTYSDDEMVASAELLSAYNPFDMYVEDATLVTVYSNLVRALAPDKARDFSPIALSNRDAVVRKASEFQSQQDDRRRLFLIDGDSDFILGIDPPDTKDLYRLGCYSIENLLAEPQAILKALSMSNGKNGESYFNNHPVLLGVRDILWSKFSLLTILLAMAHREEMAGTTISKRMASFLDVKKDHASLRRVQFAKFYNEIRRKLVDKLGSAAVRMEVRAHRARLIEREISPIHIVPGKHSLVPIIVMTWQKLDCGSCSAETLFALLAPHCTYAVDKELKTQILQRIAA